MTTIRGITDTKVYDRQGVIDRYGIPPEKIPDFIGLKGDTSDNIPGVPGIGDKTASELLQRFGDLETVLGSVDEISGAKRKQNLIEHADAARLSKQLATMVRDVPIDLDLEAELTQDPRPGEPAHGLPRLGAARPAAAARGGARGRRGRGDPAPRGRRGAHGAGQGGPRAGRRGAPPRRRARTSSTEAPEAPEGELIPRAERWRFGAYAGGGQALAGEVDDPAELVAAAGDRPVVAHDAKALGTSPPTSSSTPSSPPTCSTPPAAASRSTSCARSAGWPSAPMTRTPPAPCSSTTSRRSSATSSTSAG